jgi:DNA-binding transcriptional ArsR family regulator
MMRPDRSTGSSAAQALADPVRFAVLALLLPGPATVAALTSSTGASQSNVSNHLSLLRDRGFVRARREGRQMKYRIARPEVAEAVESLMALGGDGRSGRAPAPPAPLAMARTCYDHLAGILGVEILNGLVGARALTRPNRSTGDVLIGGRAAPVFERLGVDIAEAAGGRRRFAFGCQDWTERRPHLGGGMGAAVCRRFFDAGWVVRAGDTRVVLLTGEGRDVLTDVLDLHLGRLVTPGVRGVAFSSSAARRGGSASSSGARRSRGTPGSGD